MRTDYHLHTSPFSPDATQTIDELCTQAEAWGLSHIAITDHVDLPSHTFGSDLPFDILDTEAYKASIARAQAAHPSITILRGVELGYNPGFWDETLRRHGQLEPEFVIGSLHLVDGIDPYLPEYYEDKTRQQAYGLYLERLLSALSPMSTVCHVLGHLDYVTKFAPYDDPEMRLQDYPDLLDAILAQCIHLGLGLEINTSGYRRPGCETPLPGLSILRRYRELGGELLTLGSDAHHAKDVGYRLDDAAALAQEAGFNHYTVFSTGNPIFVPLR